jgi:hypothetical protein
MGPVALDEADQARQQSPAEIPIGAGKRVQKPDAARTVFGTCRQRKHLEQPLPCQAATKLRGDPLDGGVRQSAQPERPEISRKFFITVQAGNLFDEIHFASQVGAPAWSFNRNAAILRLGHKRSANRDEIVLERLPRQLYAEELRNARRPQKDPRWVRGTGANIHRRAL